jgi:hypothetical protein
MLRNYRRGLRRRKICARLDLTKQGLEIGPSYNGVLKKSDGCDVKILDHLPTDALKVKYIAQGIDDGQIESVDYVWDGRPYAETVAPGERFAWIVASHVIEHAPCLITFLRDCESILAPDGTLSLAVPDKRFTFDCLRERTSIAQVIDTFHAGVEKPSIGLWVIVSPWVLGFQGTTAMNVIVAALAAVELWSLYQGPPRQSAARQ